MIQKTFIAFPDDLIDLPPNPEIEFIIDLILDITLVFKATYRLTTIGLQELKVHLQELLDKEFINLGASPWETPILFLKI